MTVNGGNAADDRTRVDREPPVFPRVGDAPASDTDRPVGTSPESPLFTAADGREAMPVTASVAAQPVAHASKNGGRWRWAVAGVATMLVVAVIGGLLLLAGPRAGTPSLVAHYVPADTAQYMELRMDLPGDQQEHLASFMSHFPGFADPASFQQKFDETLNEVLRSSKAGLDWTNDVEPWFGGQLGMYGSRLTVPLVDSAGMPGFVAALSVNDRQKLEETISTRRTDVTTAPRDYNGQTVYSVAAPDLGGGVTYTITDDALLIGSSYDVITRALDVKSGKTAALADDQFFLRQLGALHADRLATFYFDLGSAIGSLPSASGFDLPAACVQTLQSAAKMRFVGELRAESNHLALTTRSQPSTDAGLPPLPGNAPSVLAESMPSGTVAYAEFRQAGTRVGWLFSQLMTCTNFAGNGATGAADIGKLFQQFLGTQPQDYFDFLDDAAVGASYRDGHWTGGLVASVNDGAVASERIDKLVSLVRLLGAGGGSSITTDEVDHNGTTITVIHVTGLNTGMPMLSGAPLPGGAPPTSLSISVAVKDGRMFLGLEDFVISALDQVAADSLAATDHFKSALAAGGTNNAGVVYVDIQQMISAVEGSWPADRQARFESDVKPFLAPLTTLLVINTTDGDISVSNIFVFVE